MLAINYQEINFSEQVFQPKLNTLNFKKSHIFGGNLLADVLNYRHN